MAIKNTFFKAKLKQYQKNLICTLQHFEPQLRVTYQEFDRADVKNDEMIGVDENDNKPEPEDATHNKVDDFNEDTFDLCAYDFFMLTNISGEPNDFIQEIKEAG